jgi:hypothetical protein
MSVVSVLTESQAVKRRAENVAALIIDTSTETSDRSKDNVAWLGDGANVDQRRIHEPRCLVASPGLTNVTGKPDRDAFLAEVLCLDASRPQERGNAEVGEVAHPHAGWWLHRRR